MKSDMEINRDWGRTGAWGRLFLGILLAAQLPVWSATTTLVPLGSTWNFLDDGSDQGTAWRASGFDDSSWSSGAAQLGYGDGDEVTEVGYGGDANNKHVTTYFRRAFQVNGAGGYDSLTLRLLRDDGAVVYLNGVEVFRSNMPGGTISSTTFASGAVGGGDESSLHTATPDPALLVEGINVLAVEIHQANSTSSDISFALELEGFQEVIQITPNAPSDGAANVSQSPTLDVSVAHLAGLNTEIAFFGRLAPPVGEDFTVIALPDTQFYSSSLNGGLPAMFTAQTDWIVQNIQSLNIVFTTQLGDCVQNGDSFESEWLNAIDALYRLENPVTTLLAEGLPYGVAVGNHDQSPAGNPDGTTTFYNQYFGVEHFSGRTYYGGHYGSNNDNHFELFSAGGLDFIIVHLEYDTTPETAVLDWANAVLQAHPNRQAILISHYFLETGNPAAFGPQGQATYDALKGNPNLFLMLSGHVSGEGRRTDVFNGQTVYTLLSDYQSRANGGNGWLRILEFSPANSTIHVQTYSPWLDQVEIDGDSDFELYYDMQSLVGDPFSTIAVNADVASGASSTALWDSLAPGTEYEWFVSVTDGSETVTSPAWRFTTAEGPPEAPTDLTAVAGDSQVSLSWTASPGANSYTVKRGQASSGPYDDMIVAGVTETTYTDLTAENDTLYFYVVSAVNGSGESPNSAEASATPKFNNPPTAMGDSYSLDEDSPLSVASSSGVLDNDGDEDGHALSAVLVNGANDGSVSLNADGSFTYTPNPNFFGVDSFDYQATDGGKFSDVATVTLTVNSVNDAPVAQDDSAVTLRDSAVTIDVLGNDSDVENDALTVTEVSLPANGSVVINPDWSIRYQPNGGFEGQDSFTYTASDGAATSVATVTVDVQKLLLFSDDFESGGFTAGGWVIVSGPSSVDASAAFTGNNGALLKKSASITKSLNSLTATEVEIRYARRVAGLSGNEALVVEVMTDGQSWTPMESVTGTVPWSVFSANVPLAGSELHLRFTLNGNAGNDAAMIDDVEIAIEADVTVPVAADDAFSVNEDAALTVEAPGVLQNDSDPEGDFLTAELVGDVSNGLLALNADGSFSYVPNADFHGTDSFAYTAGDGGSMSDPATVTITVDAVNDAPVAVDDAYAVDEDTTLDIPAPGVLGNDSDADGDALNLVVTIAPVHGSLMLNGDGSFSYLPAADYSGADSFTYSIDDGVEEPVTATVSLTISGVNDAPVAVGDTYAVDEDTALDVSTGGVLENDSDADGDQLTAVLVSNVENGSLDLDINGTFTYTPNADFFGTDSFTYAADDGSLASGPATVTIHVNPINDAPVADDDAYSLNENTPLSVPAPGVLGNDSDIDGDSLTAVLQSGPLNGALALNADGSFSYTPSVDYLGTDTFTYVANDGSAQSSVATVTLTIHEFNATPEAADDTYTVDEDTPLSVPAPGVLGNDTDGEGDPLTAVLVGDVTSGVLNLNADGSIAYTPAADFNGTDSFTYAANDGNSQSTPVTVTITVNPANDAPVAGGDAYILDEDMALTVPAPGVLGNDSDADGDTLVLQVVTLPARGQVTLNADGSFTYSPEPDYSGADSFIYSIDDGVEEPVTAMVSLTISGVNDAPVAVGDAYAVDEDTALDVSTGSVLENDSDADGDQLTVLLVSDVANGTLVLASDGTFAYTPDAEFSGTDTFTYAAEDGNGGSDSATVAITVIAVNDPPLAQADSYSLSQDTALTVPAPGVLGNDSDVDGGPLTVSLGTGPTDGSLVLNADGSFAYTPNTGFTGSDSFTYNADDGLGGEAAATVTLSVIAPPTGTHIANLDSSSINEGSTWTAEVAITVHDGNHNPLPGATVTATWGAAASGTVSSSATDDSGICRLTFTGIHKKESSVTLTIDNVAHQNLEYDADSNHDENGNSDGTAIVVGKP